MFLGIDLGTSGVKVVLLDDADSVVDQCTEPLDVQRPRPLWSEQDPDDWWRATDTAVRKLKARSARLLSDVQAVGLSGQMHGATLFDASDRALRPAILWNDGRSAEECRQLESREPQSRRITGNLAMPGFTAPKLLWVAKHEPEVFSRIAQVLLPKDSLRLRMTGEHATDLSDASGTLWLDVGSRAWSEAMLAACGLERRHVPALYEGPEPTGQLRSDVAEAWGMKRVPVVAGAGDQAAGAAGAGVVRPGDALLALGTSGVYFVSGERFQPDPERAVHAFCHCLPGRWHQMSVILSAASCISWVSRLVGAPDEASLLREVEADDRPSDDLLFLPYLGGERTPHNDPNALGVFFGLSHDTDAARLGRSVLEGVAFALRDGQEALVGSGAVIGDVSVIGGGARSGLWGRILASVLGRALTYRSGSEVGPAHGAARLARIGVTDLAADAVCVPPPVAELVEPDAALRDRYAERFETYQQLYANLRPRFAERC